MSRLFPSRRIAAAAGALLLSLSVAQAREETVVCPIDSKPFTVNRPPDPDQIGLRLDLRPIPASPAQQLPPAMDECPDNGFVLYQEAFSPEEVEALKPLVASPDFQALRTAPAPARAAWLMSKSPNANPGTIVYFYLWASWLTEDTDKEAAADYRNRAIAAVDPASMTDMGDGDRFMMQLVLVDLYRLNGDFDRAYTLVSQIPLDFPAAPVVGNVRSQLLELIARRSTDPAAMAAP